MYLPYNGDERILTAKIGDYTGNVTINGSTENITSKELVSGDEIVVPG
jgi:ribosome-associated protein YbcJ (S4-like RNA binding protein)